MNLPVEIPAPIRQNTPMATESPRCPGCGAIDGDTHHISCPLPSFSITIPNDFLAAASRIDYGDFLLASPAWLKLIRQALARVQRKQTTVDFLVQMLEAHDIPARVEVETYGEAIFLQRLDEALGSLPSKATGGP